MSGRRSKTKNEITLDKEIGARIRLRRKVMNLSSKDLAERMNYSTEHIRKIEEGTRTLGVKSVIDLSEILNTSTDYILKGGELVEVQELLGYLITELQKLKSYAETYQNGKTDQ